MAGADCKACKNTYRKQSLPRPYDRKPRQKVEPPCKTCKPELWPINYTAVDLYAKCAGQWIMGFSGPVAMNQEAVMSRMRLERVPMKARCDLLDDVLFITSVVLETKRRAEK